MDHTLPKCSLELRYLRGQRMIGAIDRQRLFDDLLQGTPPRQARAWAVRPVLSEYDHLVIAQDFETGRAIGILGAHDRETSSGPFLWLETGFVAETARGRNLLRRMIALLLIRTVTQEDEPIAVATMTCTPIAVHVLRQMALSLPNVRFAPALHATVVDLATVMLTRDITAALGCRFEYRDADATAIGLEVVQAARAGGNPSSIVAISPMLAMLDLRLCGAGLIADLRKLYRCKPGPTSRQIVVPAEIPPQKTAQQACLVGNAAP